MFAVWCFVFTAHKQRVLIPPGRRWLRITAIYSRFCATVVLCIKYNVLQTNVAGRHGSVVKLKSLLSPTNLAGTDVRPFFNKNLRMYVCICVCVSVRARLCMCRWWASTRFAVTRKSSVLFIVAKYSSWLYYAARLVQLLRDAELFFLAESRTHVDSHIFTNYFSINYWEIRKTNNFFIQFPFYLPTRRHANYQISYIFSNAQNSICFYFQATIKVLFS